MLELIKEASVRIKKAVNNTPLIFSTSLSKTFGFGCYLKLENLQKTGSFKVRGAYNRISSLKDDEKKRGVITASLGNHAQGVAWASGLLGVRSLVVMPETSPITKYMATKGYGASVIFHGKFFDEALEFALALAKENGMVFIPPYDDDLVIAGQGTIGIEIVEVLPDIDAVIVPLGGGGLISGIASALKGIKGDVTVIGVEAEASTSCIESLKAGRPVGVERRPTIADGIAVKRVGERTFSIIKEHVDSVVAVGEEAIAGAILQLLERQKLVVEGAGAAPLAAAMEGKLPAGIKNAVFVLSGGNIDVTMLDRIIRIGLIKEGRIMKMETVLQDVPGSLARLTSEVAALKANILHITHMREAVDVPIGSIRLEVILEVEGFEHADRIKKELAAGGYKL